MENKTIILEQINGLTCINPKDAIQLLIRLASTIMDEEDVLREEWGEDKRLGVILPNLSLLITGMMSIKMVIDMEGDV